MCYKRDYLKSTLKSIELSVSKWIVDVWCAKLNEDIIGIILLWNILNKSKLCYMLLLYSYSYRLKYNINTAILILKYYY